MSPRFALRASTTRSGVVGRAKVAGLAGMPAGADLINDMALSRHGAMGRLFTGVRAPSTLGTFLRSFTFGHVRQLAYLEVDDTVRQPYGYAKQGAGYGYCGVKGLNALLATVSRGIVAARLRKGPVHSACGAATGRRRHQGQPAVPA